MKKLLLFPIMFLPEVALSFDELAAINEQKMAQSDIRNYELLKQKKYELLEFEIQDELQRTAMIALDTAKKGKTSLEKAYAIETLMDLKAIFKEYPLNKQHPAFESMKVILNSIPPLKVVLEKNDGTIDKNKLKELNNKLQNIQAKDTPEILN
ncbi:MAG: hypothetical protein HWE27_15200 [Gammaproteobacteria bacterium]|nr:hypothetical protein [Gammaproteobacteria bacterium]